MKIIGSYISPYVRKVIACLNLKGIGYEIDPISPFFGNDEFERLSPLRRVPVLIDGDFAVSDSSVIWRERNMAIWRGKAMFSGRRLLDMSARRISKCSATFF